MLPILKENDPHSVATKAAGDEKKHISLIFKGKSVKETSRSWYWWKGVPQIIPRKLFAINCLLRPLHGILPFRKYLTVKYLMELVIHLKFYTFFLRHSWMRVAAAAPAACKHMTWIFKRLFPSCSSDYEPLGAACCCRLKTRHNHFFVLTTDMSSSSGGTEYLVSALGFLQWNFLVRRPRVGDWLRVDGWSWWCGDRTEWSCMAWSGSVNSSSDHISLIRTLWTVTVSSHKLLKFCF